MPELPEIETVKLGIEKTVLGSAIISTKIFRRDLRFPIEENFEKLILRKRVLGVGRRSKYLLFFLNKKKTIVLHLGMSGRINLSTESKKKYKPKKHDHLIISFDNQFLLIYNDPRRFGMFFMLKDLKEVNFFFNNYGTDLLTNKVDLNEMYNKFIRKKVSLKQALLDQSLIVGIGNIYANEALFHSKLNPQRLTYTLKKAEISHLLSSCKFVLKLSLKNGGSSINDYKSPDGTLGSFQSLFKVYQKKHVIYKKKTYKIKKIIQNGRSTFFSPALQK